MNITVVDSLHPLYKAVLARGAALGYVRPSYRGQLLQNEFVKDLIEANLWNELDVLFIPAMKSGSKEFAMIDFKHPTGTLSTLEGIGSIFYNDETGINGNGTGGYVDTKFNPVLHGVNYTQNANSVLLGLTLATGLSSSSVDTGNPNCRLRGYSNNLAAAFSVNGTEVNIVKPDNGTIGLWHLTRRATVIRLYRNGVHLHGVVNGAAALSSNSFFYCAQNNPGFGNPSTCRVGLWAAGGQFLGTEVTLNTIWQKYLTNVIAL